MADITSNQSNGSTFREFSTRVEKAIEERSSRGWRLTDYLMDWGIGRLDFAVTDERGRTYASNTDAAHNAMRQIVDDTDPKDLAGNLWRAGYRIISQPEDVVGPQAELLTEIRAFLEQTRAAAEGHDPVVVIEVDRVLKVMYLRALSDNSRKNLEAVLQVAQERLVFLSDAILGSGGLYGNVYALGIMIEVQDKVVAKARRLALLQDGA